MKYIKKVENKIIEAPKSGYVNNIYFEIGFNSKSNEKNLLKLGYLPYDGASPLSYLDIVNNEIVELIMPETIKQTIFSKLDIRRAMRSLGIENKLDELLASNIIFAKDWADANEIDLDDTITLLALKSTNINIEQVLLKLRNESLDV